MSRLVVKRAIFGRREAELLRHLVLLLSLLVETQFPQQLVDLRAGHVGQSDPIQLFVIVVQEDKLRVSPRDVLHHQVMVKRNILDHEGFDLSEPVQLSSTA